MKITGKGAEIRTLFNSIFKDSNKIDEFKKIYGVALFDLMWNNFLLPLLEEKDPIKQKEIVNRLDLFTAAFY